MRSRALAFVLAVAAFSLMPSSLEAEKIKTGGYPLYGGYLLEDNSCPAATHALIGPCTHERTAYVVFHRMKGVHRFTGGPAIIFGPSESVSCPLPLVDAKYIYQGPPPPPCAP
jgi:hypothetical protein